jgi:hypothetical protein
MPTNPINEVIQYLRRTLLPEGADLADRPASQRCRKRWAVPPRATRLGQDEPPDFDDAAVVDRRSAAFWSDHLLGRQAVGG